MAGADPAKATITWQQRVKNYWVNDGPKVVFIFVFLAANLAVFLERFLHYRYMKDPPVFLVLKYGACFARGSAASIKLTSAVILLPVLRNILSWLRGTWVNNYIPIDKNLVFHKFCAWLIAIMTTIHCVSHFWNFHRYTITSEEDLALIGRTPPIHISKLAFTTISGSTGHIVLLIMVLMYSSAVESIRRPMFEIFWFTHHLFILYYGLLSFHGAEGVLEPPTFVYWIVGPLALYLIERTVRILRGKQTTMLHLARQHPSRVIELRMKKQSFTYKPGQYLFLNCPYISKNEWHPFTITSAPDEDFVSVHINAVGNWTNGITALLNPEKKIGIVQEDLLEAPDGSAILRIDGPFGAASEEVFKYKTVVLVGAGIGVTPFASILKHIKASIQRNAARPPIDKVYFYWICRDKNSFEWFSNMIAALERENVNNFLEINTYLTGALSPDEVRDVMYGTDEESADQITGLSSPTHFGRPKWSDIFTDLARKHADQDVGVFFCGPRVLSKDLYKHCTRHTSTSAGGCRFHFNKENF
jgi:predicted ferric reductase